MKRSTVFFDRCRIDLMPGGGWLLVVLLGVGLLLVPTVSQADGYIVDQDDGSVMLTNQIGKVPPSMRKNAVREQKRKKWAQRSKQRKLFARLAKKGKRRPKLILKEVTARTDPVQEKQKQATLQKAQQRLAKLTMRCKQFKQRVDSSRRKHRRGVKRFAHQRSYRLAAKLAACHAALEDARAYLTQEKSQENLAHQDPQWHFASKDAQEQVSFLAERCKKIEDEIASANGRYQRRYDLTVRFGKCMATLENARKQVYGVGFGLTHQDDDRLDEYLNEEFWLDTPPPTKLDQPEIPIDSFEDSTITINEL